MENPSPHLDPLRGKATGGLSCHGNSQVIHNRARGGDRAPSEMQTASRPLLAWGGSFTPPKGTCPDRRDHHKDKQRLGTLPSRLASVAGRIHHCRFGRRTSGRGRRAFGLLRLVRSLFFDLNWQDRAGRHHGDASAAGGCRGGACCLRWGTRHGRWRGGGGAGRRCDAGGAPRDERVLGERGLGRDWMEP